MSKEKVKNMKKLKRLSVVLATRNEEENIGGIATRVFRVIGLMKSWWGKFNASLIKGLRKLTPIFNIGYIPQSYHFISFR